MSSVITNSLLPLDLTFSCMFCRLCVILIDRPSICHSKILNSQMNFLFLDSASQKLQVHVAKASVIILVYILILINQMSFGLMAACLEIYS